MYELGIVSLNAVTNSDLGSFQVSRIYVTPYICQISTEIKIQTHPSMVHVVWYLQ